MVSPQRRFAVALFVVGLVCTLVVPAFAGKTTDRDVSEVFDVAKPATVMVLAVYQAVISVPADASIPPDRTARLQRQIIARVRSGEVAYNQQAITQAALDEIIANIVYYLEPSAERETHERGMQGQGSGFFVTPDGYAVTNAHVVSANMDELKRQFVVSVLQDLVAKAVKEIKASMPGSLSAATIERLQNAAVKWYIRYMQFDRLTTEYYVLTGVAVPGRGAVQKGMKAELVTKGDMEQSKDVAILKVEGKNLPTLPIGDDATLRTGDPILCVGYPAAATFMPWADESATTEATCTQGTMSARKTWSGGVTVLQTDAAITHGNSGGPALDENGKVIGLTTWGATAQQMTNQGDSVTTEVQGMNFLVPISVVKQFLDRSNVKPEESLVTQLYAKAVHKSTIQHYRAAMKLLQQVNALAPGSPYVEQYISEAQNGISAGKDKTWQEWVPKAVGAVVLLLAIIGVVVAVSLKGRRRVGAAPPVATYAPSMTPRPLGPLAPPPAPGPAPPPAVPPAAPPAAAPPAAAPPPPPFAPAAPTPPAPPAAPAAPPAVPPAPATPEPEKPPSEPMIE